MNNTSNITNTIKRGRGRPKKVISADMSDDVSNETEARTGIPAMLEPNSHDISDELNRMDSFVYGRYYNE
jgi:hypothetical protein